MRKTGIRLLPGRRLAVALAALAMIAAGSASAKLKVLYDFCPKKNCSRSFSPAALLVDASGNIYGTRENDGAHAKGTAYKLSFDGSSWNYQVLHDFCSANGCTDGAQPEGGLVIDTAGNLYGTALAGGNTNHGVAFEITAGGAYNVLYSFCAGNQTCPDGAAPSGRLTYSGQQSGQPYDGRSPLYGTGVVSTNGVVFELANSGGTWTSTTDYTLGNYGGYTCVSDGLVMNGAGNLVGATSLCGDGEAGEAFVLANEEHGWTKISRFSFDIGDGYEPRGTVVEDGKGRLYVATYRGGKHDQGVLVKLSPVVDTYVSKVLETLGYYRGSWPEGGLVGDAAGNLYGTTYGGGRGPGGTVFELAGGKVFQRLYQFCLHDTNCRHGSVLTAGVVLDTPGNLYGTTTQGGKNGFGTVFEVTP